MTAAPQRLEIVIDELVMHGLSQDAAEAASAALERRLTEIAAPGAEVAQRAEASGRLASVEAQAGSEAGLGEAVADAVWGAVSGERAR